MATDATGTPTSLGIPKFNTSVDAPSGLGSNAQMDAIDALIAARVTKPAGISNGEVPLWNGSTFVRGAVVATDTGKTVSAGNTDLAWGGSVSSVTYMTVTTAGGSLRSLGAPSYSGQRVIIRNTHSSSLTLLHATAGGSGAQLFLRGAANATLAQNESIELLYDGTFWAEVGRDVATVSGSQSGLGTFTGKNNGSLTAIAMSTVVYDDFGTMMSTVNAWETIPATGKYLVAAFGQQTGGSGTGGGQWQVDRQNSSGVLQETLMHADFGLNQGEAGAAVVSATLNDRIVMSTQNGATGSAGSVQGRLGIVRLS